MSANTEQQISIDIITKDWIENEDNLKQLKAAYKLLKNSEKFNPQLYSQIRSKITVLEDKQNERQPVGSSNNTNNNDFDYESQAIDQKSKGNDALKTNDLNLAIKYYTQSIDYNPKLTASFYNRALVYLKLKKYELCIQDCNKAIELDPKYFKAYQRRFNAYFESDKLEKAIQDLKFLINNKFEVQENQKLLQNIEKLTQFNQKPIQQQNEQNQISKNNTTIDQNDDDQELSNEQEKLESQKLLLFLREIKKSKEEVMAKFKYHEYGACLDLYKKIMKKLIDIDFESQDCKDHITKQKCQILFQMATIFQKKEQFLLAAESLNQVMKNEQLLRPKFLIDILLLRAQSYQGLKQNGPAIEDYNRVRQLDKLNVKAANELYKINPQLIIQNNPDISNQMSQNSLDYQNIDIESLLNETEDCKAQGNQFFKNKNYDQAIQLFTHGIELAEENNFKDTSKPPSHPQNKNYINLLSNRSLCFYNLEKFSECEQDCINILQIDKNHQKALYRRCQASIQLENLQQADIDLKKLQTIDPNLDVSKLTNEYKQIQIQMKKQQLQESKKQKQTLEQNFINDVAKSMSVQAVQKILDNDIIPQNVTQFEKDIKVFEKNIDYFPEYLKVIFFKKKIKQNLQVIFKNQEISPEHLNMINQIFNKSMINQDSQFCLEFYDNLQKTHKFQFVIKLLMKKEKKQCLDQIKEPDNQILNDLKKLF